MSLSANYEVLDVKSGELVRVNLMDLEVGLQNGTLSTNFDPATGKPNAVKSKAVKNGDKA